jgi:hypothetical protein
LITAGAEVNHVDTEEWLHVDGNAELNQTTEEFDMHEFYYMVINSI